MIVPGIYTLSVFAENQLGTLIRPFLYINELFADTALRVSDLVDGRAAKTFTISEQMTVEFRWGLGTNGSDSGSIDMGGIQLEVGDSAGPYSEG